jgi:RNA polymerase sigma-70 factor (ECF subfamily)
MPEADPIFACLGAVCLEAPVGWQRFAYAPPAPIAASCRSTGAPLEAPEKDPRRDRATLVGGATRMSTGRRGLFDQTRWSLVKRAGGEPTKESRKALGELCRTYRAPLLAFARSLERDPERAEDLVQGFFAGLVERDVVGAADETRGCFRTFLRVALRNHARNVYRARTAEKRDGNACFVDADLDALASAAPSHDRLYDKLWAQAMLDRVLAQLGDEEARAGRGERFEALRDRLTDDDAAEPQSVTAAKLGINEGNLRAVLSRLRGRHRALVRAEVAETVSRPEDVDAELRNLAAAFGDRR